MIKLGADEMTTTAQGPKSNQRKDLMVLWGGIIFSLAFTGLIWWAGGRLDAIELLPDQGVAWYYWRLPNPTILTRAIAWFSYLAHQITIWALIYVAQKSQLKYTTNLHKVNSYALVGNAFFIAWHFVQTHLWYDGLAQDVSIFSSQGSVIVLLVWIMLMENPRRGLFFGKKVPFSQLIIRFARKYHGYFFAWATIYTFWYHPMVSTSGHLIGFLYMFLLLLQGSLFFTRIHINRWWMFANEFAVLVHGSLVAVMQGNGIWPMFAFGFGGVFIITQMHGLGLSRWVKWALLLLYIGLVLWVYSGRGWANLNEIVRIPVIDYVAVFVLAGLFWLGLWLARLVRKGRSPDVEVAPG
jgi:hypothetical protein